MLEGVRLTSDVFIRSPVRLNAMRRCMRRSGGRIHFNGNRWTARSGARNASDVSAPMWRKCGCVESPQCTRRPATGIE